MSRGPLVHRPAPSRLLKLCRFVKGGGRGFGAGESKLRLQFAIVAWKPANTSSINVKSPGVSLHARNKQRGLRHTPWLIPFLT